MLAFTYCLVIAAGWWTAWNVVTAYENLTFSQGKYGTRGTVTTHYYAGAGRSSPAYCAGTFRSMDGTVQREVHVDFDAPCPPGGQQPAYLRARRGYVIPIPWSVRQEDHAVVPGTYKATGFVGCAFPLAVTVGCGALVWGLRREYKRNLPSPRERKGTAGRRGRSGAGPTGTGSA
ncbi:hypothetical protein ACFPZN_49235 [Actinomadura rugatobispora]|uniref:DUF3592 domain-containing protein n=1 Tax=Actinomadura rugatobispora TaxID=1994 RepID=A0ABW1AGD8_9ACTN